MGVVEHETFAVGDQIAVWYDKERPNCYRVVGVTQNETLFLRSRVGGVVTFNLRQWRGRILIEKIGPDHPALTV